MIIWDENIVYFFNWEKNLFWTNKKFVCLIFINKLSWYHPKIAYENIVQKDMNKFQVTILQAGPGQAQKELHRLELASRSSVK